MAPNESYSKFAAPARARRGHLTSAVSLRTGALTLVLLAAAGLAERSAFADMIYTYTGNDFQSIDGTGPGPTTSDFLSGTLTFASALPDNLQFADEAGAVLAWSLGDGSITMSSSDPSSGSLSYLDLSTDANGDIAPYWIFQTNGSTDTTEDGLASYAFYRDNQGNVIFGQTPNILADVHDFNTVDTSGSAIVYGEPGTWTESSTGAPEPSAWLMLAGGLGMAVRARPKPARSRTSIPLSARSH